MNKKPLFVVEDSGRNFLPKDVGLLFGVVGLGFRGVPYYFFPGRAGAFNQWRGRTIDDSVAVSNF